MGNALPQIRTYVIELLRSTRASLADVERQLRSPRIQEDGQTAFLVGRVLRMQQAHADELAEHLMRLGAGAIAGQIPVGAVAPGDATVERALREDYAILRLAQAGALMLETNARTLGFSSTAALAGRHRDEIEKLLAEIKEVLPLAA